MITVMTTNVTHVITHVNIFKVKVSIDDKISRYFPDIAQHKSPFCISIMPISLSNAFMIGLFCDNVALVIFREWISKINNRRFHI
jgi:hypothetical protein